MTGWRRGLTRSATGADAMTEFVIAPMPREFDRWDELHALITQAFAYMDGVIDPPSSARRLTTEGLRTKAQSEQVFIAHAGDKLIGCAFADDRNDHVYVGKVAVDGDWRKSGVGRALIAQAETYARALGRPALELQVRVELTGNQAAFARLGFVETGRTAHEGYERMTGVTMRKAL